MEPSGIVRAAVVQAASALFDRDATLSRAVDLIAEAAASGAQLIVFPEAFLSGYPRGLDLGAVVGSRSDEGREAFRRYWESSVDVPGPTTAALADVAAEHGVHLVMGVVERDGGTLYCTVLFFDDGGRLLGKHRKLMPTGSERLVWGFGDGSTLPVFDTPLGRLGAAICWENYMPMLRMALYGKGVQLYCAPTADMRDTWLASMRHVAVEGRCFVLSCNQFVRGRDYPDDLRPAGVGPDSVVSRGGSCIIDPFGTILAGPDVEGETILTADLDLRQIARGKYDLDVVGHYARPDVFSLRVDEGPKRAVTFDVAATPAEAAKNEKTEKSEKSEKSEPDSKPVL